MLLGGDLKKWVNINTFSPVSLSVYEGRVYFANAGSSAIEVFDSGKFSVLHRDIPKILWLGIVHQGNLTGKFVHAFSNVTFKLQSCAFFFMIKFSKMNNFSFFSLMTHCSVKLSSF